MELKIYHTGPFEVNTYLLMDNESKESLLIDVGGSFSEIKEFIDQSGFTLKFILNTHGHFDHVLGESEAIQLYPNIPVYMHKDDISHIEKLKEEMRFFKVNKQSTPPEIKDFIDEDSQLYLGKNKIEIFHTPGHSAGSLSYYIDGKLFSGDALFQRSIGRTDFYDGDFDTLINSIKTKLLTLNENTIVYPGHGANTTIKDEKKYNFYLK